mmetsp:Transcript_43781/g.115470  ORF Transcript_43781/g.115470 Transcript_43781/m.115470 type:complete len:550 (+) Transcript_43781:155-1804(+)
MCGHTASVALALTLSSLVPYCGEGVGALRSVHVAQVPLAISSHGELEFKDLQVAALQPAAVQVSTGLIRKEDNSTIPLVVRTASGLRERLRNFVDGIDLFTRPIENSASVSMSDVMSSAPAADWMILLGTVVVLMLVDLLVLRRLSPLEASLPLEFESKLQEIYDGCEGAATGKVTKMDLLASCVRREDAELLFGVDCAKTWGGLCSKLGAKFHSLTGEQDQTLTWEEFRCFYINELLSNSGAPKSMASLRTHGGILLFWLLIAAAFNGLVWFRRGSDAGFEWCTGYLLEWILSLDNLFVFHLIFQAYATPRALLHKALFYGIFGAAIFRMCMFMVLASLLHLVHWVRFAFGALLIYSGLQAASGIDDESDEVADNMAVRLLKRCLGSRLLDRYDCVGQRLLVWESGQWRATLLVLVIALLELTDVVFAVDSVSAKVAQIPDYYIAYSSSVIAMFGLRAMFFIIQDLVDYFELLKFGLCLILVFIGFELMASDYIKLDPQAVCVMFLAVFAMCVAGSAAQRRAKVISCETCTTCAEVEGTDSSSQGERK